MEKETRFRSDINYNNKTEKKIHLKFFKEKLPDEIVNQLFLITKKNKFLSFIALFAAFQITATKIMDKKSVVICTPNLKDLINLGEDSNTHIAFECDIDENITVKDFINNLKNVVVEKYQNDLDTNNMQSNLFASEIFFAMDGIHCVNDNDTASTTFRIAEEDDTFYIGCKYNNVLYSKYYIQKICNTYTYVLTQIIKNVRGYIKDIELVDSEEKVKLFQFNKDYCKINEPPIFYRFENQVEKKPDANAITVFYNGTEILKSFGNINSIKSNIWKKCCFAQNPYLVSLLEMKDLEKNKMYAIRTNLRNTVIINQNVLNLLGYMNGINTLDAIYYEIINHHSHYYIENRAVSEHSWKSNSSTVEINCHLNVKDFLSIIHMMKQANLISFKQMKTLDYGITNPMTFLKPLRTQKQEERNRNEKESKILLLGDTPGEASVGILYIASFLKRNGLEAYCQFNDLNDTYNSLYKNIIHLLKIYRPEIVGISAKWFPHIARVLTMCDIIKEYNPNIKIVLGGNTASLYPEKFIMYDTIDYVVCGDGELPLLSICRGEDDIPNCIYKKNGRIIKNKISYVQDENNSSEIYLSDLEQIIVNHDSILNIPYIYIYTGKGCSMNCFYCGGCNEAQGSEFLRYSPFIRKEEETRIDILEAIKITSTLMFVDSFSFDTTKYYTKLWSGIDLTNHFCDFYFYKLPSFKFIRLMCNTFRFVYINIDLCSLSERHRKEMFTQKVIKPLPSDSDLFKLFEVCEQFENLEIGLSLISGLPFFKSEDFKIGKEIIKQLKKFKRFKGLEWGRLHAQPMAPILKMDDIYDMKSQAKTFEDFLEFSKKNMEELIYPDIYSFHVPYIFFNEDISNSKVTKYYGDINRLLQEEVSFNGVYEKITYNELNQVSNQFARQLQQNGVNEKDVIGLMLDEPLEIIISILAILKIGAIYCPIDLNSPVMRTSEIIKSCKIETIIVSETLEQNYSVKMLSFDFRKLRNYSSLNLNVSVSQKAYAYIIYTSGTTGEPKGVCIKNESLSNLFRWRIENYKLTSQDTILQLLPYFFDGYATNLFSALLSGGELVLMNERDRKDMLSIKEVIRHNKVTNMSIIPSMYQAMIDSLSNEDFKSMKSVILAAEKARSGLIKSSQERLPNISFINEYGPTENTIVTTANIGMTDSNTNIIGKPIKNVHVFIMNSSKKLLPVGLYGEICISGIGLANGYLCNAVKENNPFIKNPWEDGMMYRTGDIGRWMKDGTIEFFGREDGQVKIRGNRIETKEIELYLESLSGVYAAVVKGIDYSNEIRLAAFVETRGGILDILDIQNDMASYFPEYMVPSYFYQLKEFPVSKNGKIDRNKICQKIVEQEIETDMQECNDIEKTVIKIWENVLNSKKFKLTDNFFDVGGNSISLMRMQAEIEKKCNVGIPIGDLFQYTTISSLSEYLSSKTFTSNIDKHNFEYISIPLKYLSTVKEEKIIINYIEENRYDKLINLSEKKGIKTDFALCGLFCYLLSELFETPNITCYIIKGNTDIISTANINFEILKGFEELFDFLEEICSKNFFENKFTTDILRLEKSKKGLIPIIALQCNGLTDILKKDNILTFSIDVEKKIKLTISCDLNTDAYLKLQRLMVMFFELLDQFLEKI